MIKKKSKQQKSLKWKVKVTLLPKPQAFFPMEPCVFFKKAIKHMSFKNFRQWQLFCVSIHILIAIFMKLGVLKMFLCQHKQIPFNDCRNSFVGSAIFSSRPIHGSSFPHHKLCSGEQACTYIMAHTLGIS